MTTPFATLFEHCLLILSGNETQTMLQGQLGCDMHQLDTKQAQYTTVCNRQGQVVASLWVMQHQDQPNTFYLLTASKQTAQIVLNVLTPFTQLARITMQLSDDTVLMASQQLHIEHSSQCHTYQTAPYSMQLIIGPHETMTLIQKHFKIKYKNGTLDHDHWLVAMIQNDIPIIDHNNSAIFTPHKLGSLQTLGINLKKGCFVGQEIIARTEYLGKKKHSISAYFGPKSTLTYYKDTIKIIQSVHKGPNCHALITASQQALSKMTKHL